MTKILNYLIRSVYYSLRGIEPLGLWGSVKFFTSCLTFSTIKITPKGFNEPLLIRGRTSDVVTFYSLIIRKTYPILQRDVRIIVDAGANVGYAAAYFANAYPDAKVIAIEPEKDNFEILQKNCRSFSNVVPIMAALWNKKDVLFLQDPSTQPWAFQYGESRNTSTGIETVTVPELMREFRIKKIDLLKIDIEGAEKAVFSTNTGWLESVDTIFVEIHDWIIKGASWEIFNALRDFDYNFDIKSEYAIFENIQKNDLVHRAKVNNKI